MFSSLVKNKKIKIVLSTIIITCIVIVNLAASSIPLGQMTTLPNSLVVDKWMLQSDGQTVADYLDQTYPAYGNKTMQEMINVVWVDPYATSSSNAQSRFEKALSGASTSFYKSSSHSGGYTSYLNNTLYQQLPNDGNTAYVDKGALSQNIHHLRAFGQINYQNAWYITIASSTENYNWLKFTHTFSSFNTTRDTLVNALLTSKKNPGCVKLPDLNLNNQIAASDPNLTTGDFDGVTAYIQAPVSIS